MIDMQVSNKLEGKYQIKILAADGSVRLLTDWFSNLITNSGLDRMAQNSDYLMYCLVGSSREATTVNDVSMPSVIARTTNATQSWSTGSEEPYYISVSTEYVFQDMYIVGSISEVGIGWNHTGTELFSHALITNKDGIVSPIKLIDGDTLVVTYELRMYPSIEDKTGVVSILGIPYNWTVRSAGVTDIREFTLYSWNLPEPGNEVYLAEVVDSPITTKDSYPVGESANIDVSISAYTPGSYKQSFLLKLMPADGNLVNGIQSIILTIGWACYQIGFTPTIMKTDRQIIAINITHSWGRRLT